MPDDDLTKDIATELVKQTAGKAYDDAVHPAAGELGKAGQTLGKTLNMLLSPIRRLALKVEAGETKFQRELEEKLNQIPEERLIEPDPAIAVPLLEGGIRNDDKPDLRAMFANLMASAMDRETAGQVHPNFIYTLQQLTSDEAKILLFMRGPDTPYWRSTKRFLVKATAQKRNDEEPTEIFGATEKLHISLTLASRCSQHEHLYIRNLHMLNLISLEKVESKNSRVRKLLEETPSREQIEESEKTLNSFLKGSAQSLVNDKAFDHIRSWNPKFKGSEPDTWVLEFIKLTEHGYDFLEACAPSADYIEPEPTDQ